MEENKFLELVDQRFKYCRDLMASKSKEYSRNQDKLHNFKVAGRVAGVQPETALMGMKLKHDVSLMDIVRDIELTGTVCSFPVLAEKITDSIDYLLLQEALITERIEAKK